MSSPDANSELPAEGNNKFVSNYFLNKWKFDFERFLSRSEGQMERDENTKLNLLNLYPKVVSRLSR